MNLFQSAHLHLTGFTAEDVETITRWYQDDEYLRALSATIAFPDTPLKWQKWYESLPDLKDEYIFAIRLRADQSLIGWIALDGILWNHGAAWLSIAVGEAHQRGQGYGYEACELILRYAFHELNLHRVQLTVFANNHRAIRLYERLGFVREGVYREYLHRDGQRFDMYLYGILRSEWQPR
ncbi:MAG: GNAT family N-acetyltransferase [Anaerolineae bacterium]|jgi:RimJ/RimL family protein N-acetyltransferase|nr:GNAT family N-acetyltransferase [Anaerolineae bacterium]